MKPQKRWKKKNDQLPSVAEKMSDLPELLKLTNHFWIVRGTVMPTKKGIRKPRHKAEIKDLAVSLYVSDASASLQDVAEKLNSQYHFNPPLSSDSIGRWVQAKKERMKRPSDLIWTKRREKYGKSGLTTEKREALVKLRTSQWANPWYKKDMGKRMSDFPQETVDRIIHLYAHHKKTPANIRRTLRLEGIRKIPALSTIHQILNKNQIPKHDVSPLDIIIDVPCFKCLLTNAVSPSHCKPECEKLELWLLTQQGP
jgi:hypothetical protein